MRGKETENLENINLFVLQRNTIKNFMVMALHY